jgi:hypothetical protein
MAVNLLLSGRRRRRRRRRRRDAHGVVHLFHRTRCTMKSGRGVGVTGRLGGPVK